LLFGSRLYNSENDDEDETVVDLFLIATKKALLNAMFAGALALFADQLLLDLDQGPGVFLRVGRWISSCQI
jgi:hypothetical protein